MAPEREREAAARLVRQTSSTKVFNGALDELRISNVARSAEWVKATYDTIKNNTTFTIYGAARENTKGHFLLMLR